MSSTVSSSDDYVVNPLRIMLFGLGPEKTRAQVKAIADMYCRAHGVVAVRTIASPGKAFCSIIVGDAVSAGKCLDNEVTTNYNGQSFRILGKPDREPRTQQQKAGVRVTDSVFNHVQEALRQARLKAP